MGPEIFLVLTWIVLVGLNIGLAFINWRIRRRWQSEVRLFVQHQRMLERYERLLTRKGAVLRLEENMLNERSRVLAAAELQQQMKSVH